MTLKDTYKFAENFAYDFISNECMEKEFANIKCSDAQNIKIHLQNSLDLGLQDWLIENGIEIED